MIVSLGVNSLWPSQKKIVSLEDILIFEIRIN